MALDKLVDSTQLDSDLTSVADAIRTKGGTSAQLAFPADFVTAIGAIPTGGSSRPSAPDNDVILIDFDGEILYSYSKVEFANLSALPTIPVLKYSWLTQDGWNWTLSDAKAYVAKYGELVIGAQYTIADGKNIAYYEAPEDGFCSINIKIANSGASSGNTITVDWGDNTTPTTETGIGRNVTKNYTHTYATSGKYVITASCTNPYYQFATPGLRGWFIAMTHRHPSGGTYTDVLANGSADLIILTGASTTIGKLGQNRFTGAFVFPRSYQRQAGNSNWFSNNKSVKYVSWPKGFLGALYGYNYEYAYSLRRISVPEETTEINAATCNYAVSLTRITIPENVATIASKAFNACQMLKEIHFHPATPPTVAAADAFGSLPTTCKIYVPTGKLTNYTTASNYPDPLTYTYVEE